MIIRPLTRPLTSPRARGITDAGVGGFSPAALFASGEQGVWYDPSDLSTLFQDAAGTTPVTAIEQPVGLMLDKRLGLVRGTQLVSNGGFDSGLTGWSVIDAAPGTTTLSSGAVVMNNNETGTSRLRQSFAISAATYEVEFTVSGFSGAANTASLALGSTTSGDTAYGSTAIAANGVYRRIITTTAGTLGIAFVIVAGGATTATIDNISVRELPGNHASQSTTANKPLWQTTYAAFDRFDDYLATTADGGGTTGILLCAGIRAGGAGSARTIWSDRDTNNGYRLSINASNQLVLSAGNGAAHTEVLGPTITAGTDYVVMGWHDGTNLNARVNLAAATSAAFATAAAGTAGFTIGRDNGTASDLYGDRLYGLVYRKNDTSTAAQRDGVTRYLANKSGVTL